MFRPISAASFVCLMLFFAATANAQQVKIVKKPAPEGTDTSSYSWTVSFSRDNGPNTFELDQANVTEEQARSEAEALKTWNKQMGNAGGWNLHTILLEGEPSDAPTADEGIAAKIKELSDKISELKEKLETARSILEGKADERKIADTFKEYVKEIEGAYQRAVDLKKWLTDQTKSISKATFDQVNDLIGRYNMLPIQYNEVAPAGNKNIFAVIPLVTSSELAGKIVDKPSNPSAPKPVPSIEAKYFSGMMAARKVFAEFQAGGAVVLRDPTDRTTEIGRGVWAQHRDRLQLTTDRFAYIGKVTDDGLGGNRFPKSGGSGGDAQVWSLKPDKGPAVQPPPPPPAQPQYFVWGKQYSGSRNKIGEYVTLDEARAAMKSDAARRSAKQYKVWIEDTSGKQVDAITVGYPPGF